MIPIDVVLFCCDGIFQRDLMWRLHENFRLRAIALQVDTKDSPVKRFSRYINPIALRYLIARTKRRGYNQRANAMMRALFYRDGSPPSIPTDVPVTIVENINDPATEAILQRLRPDVVCVNGTRLIREPLLNWTSTLPLGMINLHTGLSPYSRGGNCNLFMLIERCPHLVGITVHHISKGIDSGDIIITARPELSPDDNFEMIDLKTFRLGNDCMVTAVRQLQEGRAERVKQWTEGKLFLRRTGYVYEPYHHVTVNRVLSSGLIADYLRRKQEIDPEVRLIGSLQ